MPKFRFSPEVLTKAGYVVGVFIVWYIPVPGWMNFEGCVVFATKTKTCSNLVSVRRMHREDI